MTSKNNQVDRLTHSMPLTQRYALRKLSVGVASVLLGTSIAMGINGEVVHADTTNTPSQATTASNNLPATMGESAVMLASSANNTAENSTTTVQNSASSAADANVNSAADQLKATTPVDPSAYTVGNVKVTSEEGDGATHTGHTTLSFDMNLDVNNHNIEQGNYINVSMGIPYTTTADGQQHILAYGGGAEDAMAVNLDYTTLKGDNKPSHVVVGYVRPVSSGNRSYADSYHDSPTKDVENVAWQASRNDNELTSNGIGASNDSYQIIFNDELAKLKKKYGDRNLSLAQMHFYLTWHNISGFDLNQAPLDSSRYHLFGSGDKDTTYVPANDVKIGKYTGTSGLTIKVTPKATDKLTTEITPESTTKYAAHSWYYSQTAKKWGLGSEILSNPGQTEAVKLAYPDKLGKDFTITVTRPADTNMVKYNFVGDDDVRAALMDSIVVDHKNYDLDPVDGANGLSVTRTMISSTVPDVKVVGENSADGLTRTYHVTVGGDYNGFNDDKAIALITWAPTNPADMLPPETITTPDDDVMEHPNDNYLGVALRNQNLQKYLENNPWHLKIDSATSGNLYNHDAGYYVQSYKYQSDVNSNVGIITGNIDNVQTKTITETINYRYEGTGAEAAPSKKAEVGFSRYTQDDKWQPWTSPKDYFDAVKNPTIPGYQVVKVEGDDPAKVSVKKGVDQIKVNHDSADLKFTIYYAPHFSKSEETGTGTRTIHYVYANGPKKGQTAAPDATQTVNFTRTVTTNDATGEKTYGDWHATSSITTVDGKNSENKNKDSFAAVSSPAINDYTPDRSTVAAVVANEGAKLEEIVNYTTEPHNITYTVVDDVTGTELEGPTHLTSGFAETPVPGDATKKYNGIAKTYVAEGYTFVKEDPLATTFAHEDQNFVIHLTHGTKQATDTKLVNETINYLYQGTNKSAAPAYNAKPVKFTRNGTTDLVTGNTTWQDWTSADDTFTSVANPKIKGYDVVKYEGDDSSKVSATGVDTITVTPETSDLHFTIYYAPHFSKGEETGTATRTIHYVYANGPKQGQTAAPDATQTVKFTRTVTTNDATGEKTYGDWHLTSSITTVDGKNSENENKDHFAAVDSPAINDYTPDRLTVAAVVANEGAKLEEIVNYTTEPHKITYTVIDDATGLTLENDVYLTKGYADTQLPIKATTTYAGIVPGYENQGYTLVSEQQLPTVFAHKDQNLVIHLTHGTKQVTDTKQVKEDIRYQFSNGDQAAPTYNADPVEFTRTGTTDLVTNKTTWDAWTPANGSFKAVDSPEIQGYTPNQIRIDEQQVDPSSADLHFLVIYTPNEAPTHPDQPNSNEPGSSSTPDSSSSSDQPGSSSTPSSSSSADQPTPSTPTNPDSSAEPGSSANSQPSTPATPAEGENPTPGETPTVAEPAASQASVVTPQADSAVTTVATASQSQAQGQTKAKTLPQTGNQHRSIWQVILGAILGLFGITLGAKRKRN